jgi:hypothetical protein
MYLGYDATESGGSNAISDRDITVNATDGVGDNANPSSSRIKINPSLLNDMAATPPSPLPKDNNDGAPRQPRNANIEQDTSTPPQVILEICASHSHARTYLGFYCVHASGLRRIPTQHCVVCVNVLNVIFPSMVSFAHKMRKSKIR